MAPVLLPAFLLPKGELPLPLRLSAFFGIGLVLYFALLSLELKGLLVTFRARLCQWWGRVDSNH